MSERLTRRRGRGRAMAEFDLLDLNGPPSSTPSAGKSPDAEADDAPGADGETGAAAPASEGDLLDLTSTLAPPSAEKPDAPAPAAAAAAAAPSPAPAASPFGAYAGGSISFSDLDAQSASPLRDTGAHSASFFERLGGARARRHLEYDVTFDRGPIGLNLEVDWNGKHARVRGFQRVSGAPAPARASGLIHEGDVLTHINGESTLEREFAETLEALRAAGDAGPHTLHFKAPEALGDLAQYTGGGALAFARRLIHEQKSSYYQPPDEGDEMVYCCLERHRGEHVTAFHLHREDTGAFVIACSCAAVMDGVFKFHTMQDSHTRKFADIADVPDSATYLGCLRINFFGTEFVTHDHRTPALAKDGKTKAEQELGLVSYSTNVMGRVPNFMRVALPRAQGDAEAAEPDPAHAKTLAERWGVRRQQKKKTYLERASASMSRLFKFTSSARSGDDSEDGERAGQFGDGASGASGASGAGGAGGAGALGGDDDDDDDVYGAIEQQDHSDLLIFETKKPSWNEELAAWTLNFNGRVKRASKKNFLLVAEKGNVNMEEFPEDTVFLRFGKMSKTRFSLDFRYPLSPLVALGIACTTFAKKMVVT